MTADNPKLLNMEIKWHSTLSDVLTKSLSGSISIDFGCRSKVLCELCVLFDVTFAYFGGSTATVSV